MAIKRIIVFAAVLRVYSPGDIRYRNGGNTCSIAQILFGWILNWSKNRIQSSESPFQYHMYSDIRCDKFCLRSEGENRWWSHRSLSDVRFSFVRFWCFQDKRYEKFHLAAEWPNAAFSQWESGKHHQKSCCLSWDLPFRGVVLSFGVWKFIGKCIVSWICLFTKFVLCEKEKSEVSVITVLCKVREDILINLL